MGLAGRGARNMDGGEEKIEDEAALHQVRRQALKVNIEFVSANPTGPLTAASGRHAAYGDGLARVLEFHGHDIVREYYVKNSQEFIDYALRINDTVLLAIEAKPLQADLTDKQAAQLIQYCAVEGIEWAVLTNARPEIAPYPFTTRQPMPGMMESKAKATHTKDGMYEAKALLGMGGMWVVTANVTLPNLPPISEKFQLAVAGGGM